MPTDTEDFRALAKEAGIPTTQSEINAEFNKVRVDSGLTVTNANAFGPFWKFVDAVVTSAALWLINLVIEHVLPQSYAKTATGEMLKKKAWDVGVVPKVKVKAKGHIRFTRFDDVGALTVPKHSVVQSVRINGSTYSLKTVEEVAMGDGVLSALIMTEALSEGADYNLGAGFYTVLPESIDGIASVTNEEDWLSSPGADDESDDELRPRIPNQFSAVNQWHTDAVYRAIIAGFDNVHSENVFFEHDAPDGPGTANAFVMFESGTPSVEFIQAIQSAITDSGNHGHGDLLTVKTMPTINANVVATVWLSENLTAQDESAALSEIEHVIRCAFRENNSFAVKKARPWSIYSLSKLGEELHDEIDQLVNVDFNVSHIETQMNIPKLASLTVQKYV